MELEKEAFQQLWMEMEGRDNDDDDDNGSTNILTFLSLTVIINVILFQLCLETAVQLEMERKPFIHPSIPRSLHFRLIGKVILLGTIARNLTYGMPYAVAALTFQLLS